MKFNPRYTAYASAHGKTPDEMLEHDRAEWPGGCMCGFLVWISGLLTKFRKSHPEAFVGDHISDQEAWTRFIWKKAKGGEQ